MIEGILNFIVILSEKILKYQLSINKGKQDNKREVKNRLKIVMLLGLKLSLNNFFF